MGGFLNKPENTNYLQKTKYLVTFPEIADTTYFCQKVNLPGVQTGTATQVTPNLDLFVPGTKIVYNEFRMEFLVNEDLSSWLAIHDWIKNTTTDRIRSTRTKGQAVLSILSNHNNPKYRVTFYDIFPLSISDIQFDTTSSAEEHVLAEASFKYNYFDIVKL
jgi:hypothetical protein